MQQTRENKPIAYGFYPFWFWNGDISESEIRWQIKEMSDKGIRGFFIHSRQGLRQPYLSEEFFRMVQVAVEAAEELGLIVHLYDEYPYPSGVAGGEVILGNPQFHATRLVQQAFDAPGGPLRKALPRGRVLSCMAYPVSECQIQWSRGVDLREYVGVNLPDNSYNETGLTKYNQKRYFASNPTPVLETDVLQGPHRIFVSVQALVEYHKYCYNFVDVLNLEAIQHFIQLTHERYWKRFGDRFGKSIHSIFVDETSPGWSPHLPEAFRAECGYDLLTVLPALQDRSHPDHLKVAFDLYRLRYKLFCRSFEKQVSQWCAEHNLRYSGEKPSMRLSQLRYMDIPGCEPGHTKAGAPMDLLRSGIRQNARATASAAYFYGKAGSLCECFHSLGWSGTIQDAKIISEGLMLMGIRYLVPHGFFYTTHSLAKHDAPPTFFFQMPYWPLFGHLSKRLGKIAAHFEGTYIDADILVVDPNSGLPSSSDLKDYESLLNILMEEHLDFLIVDTDILESGRIENKRVHIRDIAASAIVLPHAQIVEESLRTWLSAFEQAGGNVIHLRESFDREDCMHLLLECVKPRLRISAVQGDARKLQVVNRTDGKRNLWFILNTGGERIDVELDAGADLQEIPLDDDLTGMLSKTDGVYIRTIHPFESLLIKLFYEKILSKKRGGIKSRIIKTADKPASETVPPEICIPVGKPVRITTESKNLLRMYEWQMELLDEDGVSLQTATVPAIPLPNQLAYGKFRFAPRINTFFGCTPELALPLLSVKYHFQFENRFSGGIELVMEPGSIVGDWYIKINESEPIKAPDFRNTKAHVRGSLGVDITSHVRQGINTITVALKTDSIDGGLLNPLYLAGDFGVELDPVMLVDFGSKGGFEAWEENGLPYYAGVIEYETEFRLDELPGAENTLVRIDHGIPFQDATEVAINGGQWRPMPWSPYCALLRTSELKEGTNSLKIKVYTTLIRSFEGQWFDIEHHCYRRAGYKHLWCIISE